MRVAVRPVKALGSLVSLLGAGLLLASCGEDSGPEPAGGPATPGPSLAAGLSVPGPLAVLDPLHARSRSERMAARQIFEPLVSRTQAPFEQGGARRGPARPLGASAGRTIWTFQIRPRVRFHDGTPLNADEVLINVERWQASGVADELLAELVSADSPIPGQVRFRLSEPVRDFPDRLGNGRLGLVPAETIRRVGTAPIRGGYVGTGAFELRELDGEGALLAGSADWWGGRIGLGPGVERLELSIQRPGERRLEALLAGRVQIADGLPRRSRRALVDDPLLTSISGGGATLGLQRSVRGIDSARADQPLSGLWLTTLR